MDTVSWQTVWDRDAAHRLAWLIANQVDPERALTVVSFSWEVLEAQARHPSRGE